MSGIFQGRLGNDDLKPPFLFDKDSGTLGVLSWAISTGSTTPDPAGTYPEATAGQRVPLSVDKNGSLSTRGQVFTDEHSYYDDFIQATLDPNWVVSSQGSGISYSIDYSILKISTGTDASNFITIYQTGDHLPLLFSSYLRIDGRQNGNVCYVGFSNENVPEATNREVAVVVFENANSQIVTFRTSSSSSQIETTDVILPNGGNTESWHKYSIQLGSGYTALVIDDNIVAKHYKHVPSPYGVLNFGCHAYNRAALSKTSGGTAITPVNFDFSSSLQALVTVLKGAEGSTITGGTLAVNFLIPTSTLTSFSDINWLVPNGSSYAISITPPPGNTSLDVYIRDRFYMLDGAI